MRRWLLGVVLFCGCQFQHGAVGADGGGVLETDALDLPPGDHWLFESAGDFAGTGYDAHDVTIDPRGALTLDGYVYGGLIMYGKEGTQLWNTSSQTFDWADTQALVPDGAGLWNTDFVDTNAQFGNIGIANATKFTIWFEGEIYLDAGDLLTLDADGAGFVDLRMPTGWTQMLIGKADGTHATTTPIATTGWYEVRLAWGEGTGSGHMDFRRSPSSGAVHFARHRMRSAVSKMRGTLRQVFNREIFGGGPADNLPPVSSFERSDLMAAQTFPTTVLGANSTDNWSARWAGQMYAATAGAYTVQVASDDGDRIILDGTPMMSHWAQGDASGSAMSTVQANLTEGWHDLIVDYNQVGGGRDLIATITAAPDAALVGAPIPLARLRPVEPRGDRIISGTAKFQGGQAITVVNNVAAGSSKTLVLDGFANEDVTSVDVNVNVTTQHLDQLVFSLQAPGGAKTTLANHPTGGAFSGYFQLSTVAAGVIGHPPAGSWILTVADDTGGANNTTYDEVDLTVHTSGGPEKIALAGSWVSPVKDIGKAPVHVIDVVWSERAAMPNQVFVRSCAMADCSDDPPWGNALAQHGTAEAATRYLQLKVAMTSDGNIEPELGALAVTYRTD